MRIFVVTPVLSFVFLLAAPLAANAGPEVDPEVYSCDDYRYYNPDLNVLGTCEALLNHWKTAGINEGRRASALFHSFQYKEQFSDLAALTPKQAINHYVNNKNGRRLGRWGVFALHPDVFDLRYYFLLYTDLRSLTDDQARRHWVKTGINEKRTASPVFTPDEYLALNSDIRAVYGNDRYGAIAHYAQSGKTEGRAATTQPRYPAGTTSVFYTPVQPEKPFVAKNVKINTYGFSVAEGGTCPAEYQDLCTASALVDTFAGVAGPANDAKREAFRQDNVKYMGPNPNRAPYTDCPPVGQPEEMIITSFSLPHEVKQSQFLQTIKQNLNSKDFMHPNARKRNAYRGDEKCFFVAASNESLLQYSNGKQVYFDPKGVQMIYDNRLNPHRWIAWSVTHFHEQPSFSLFFWAKPETRAHTKDILARAYKGQVTERIVLFYDLELTVKDYRAAMNEFTIDDMIGPETGLLDLTSTIRRNVRKYMEIYPHRMDVSKYYDTRMHVPTYQLSLAVNFQEDGVKWREAEFMIAGMNYAVAQAPGFEPTSNISMNQFIPEGGNSGGPAWTRLTMPGLAQETFRFSNPDLTPIRHGGQYIEIPDGGVTKQRLRGQIDLTDYYRLSIGHEFFPGAGGYWNGVVPNVFKNPDGTLAPEENHAIYWATVIFEQHGPFRTEIRVNEFDIKILPK